MAMTSSIGFKRTTLAQNEIPGWATITVGNSYSRITGLNVEHLKVLRALLSYVVGGKGAYYGKYGPRHKSIMSKKGEFPSGVLPRVKSYLSQERLGFTIKDSRVAPKTGPRLEIHGYAPYQDQWEAARQACLHNQGIISACTGSGKSLIIAMIIANINVKTLVVVPSLEIKKQLEASIATALGHKRLPSWITVANIDSKKLKAKVDYDCLIIDEGHHVAAKTYQDLNKTVWTDIYYRFYLTATAFRNDPEETLLFEGIVGNVIFDLPYRVAVAKGYVVPVEAYYIEAPKVETSAYTYAQVYNELVVNNVKRNMQLEELIANFKYAEKSTLVLVREVAHGEILSKLTSTPFVNGRDEDSRDYIDLFNRKEIPVLIGTTGIMGEGVDSKACEYVIIAGLGKAKSQFMQAIGRCVRTYPGKESGKVIIVLDKSHKFTRRHFREQCKIILDEYGVKPIKLNL